MKIGFVVACAALMGCSWAGSYQPLQGQGIKNPQGGSFTSAIGTVAYGGTMMGYGGTVEDDHLVTMSGEITATWVWVRDRVPNPDPNALTDGNPNNDTVEDPLDVPPEEVIVVQYCDASYTGMYYSGDSGVGSCSNGLGSPEVSQVDTFYTYDGNGNQVVWHYVVSGRSVGIKSEQRAGSETLTVTCSPSSQVHVPLLGLVGARINYSCGIITPSVLVEGTTEFFQPRSIGVIAGQQMKASTGIQASPEAAIILQNFGNYGIRQNSQVWRLPGNLDPFKDFVYSENKGEKVRFGGSDLRQSEVKFYCNLRGSDLIQSSFDVELPTGTGLSQMVRVKANSKVITVYRPEGMFQSRTGEIGRVLVEGGAGFQFHGNQNSAAGQEWYDVSITLASPFALSGQEFLCQLITARRELRRELSPAAGPEIIRVWRNVHYGFEALDAGFPYPFAGTEGKFRNGYFQVPAERAGGVDSPYQWFYFPASDNVNWLVWHSQAVDTFRTWLMYEPPAKPGFKVVPIPLASYEWNWSCVSKWTQPNLEPEDVSPGGYGVTKAPGQTTQFPTWNRFSKGKIEYINVG